MIIIQNKKSKYIIYKDQTYWDTTRESWRSELRELLGE